MGISDKYILDGHTPVICKDIMEWGESMKEHRHVALLEEAGVRVSTVFLGIDHGFGDGSPPILFETMIFGGEHDDYQMRYSTWEEAEAGHITACKKAGLLKWLIKND